MSQPRIPRAAAVEIVVPTDRVIESLVAAGIGRFVERRQHVHVAARICLVVVQLVGPHPSVRQMSSRGVRMIGHYDGRLQSSRRMTWKVRAHQLAVPRPAIFGVGGGMDARKAAPGLDVILHRRLLGRVEYVAGRVEKDDGFVLRQIRPREGRRIFGRRDRKVVRRAQCLNRRDPLVNRIVPKSGCLREHEHVIRGHHPPRLEPFEAQLPLVAQMRRPTFDRQPLEHKPPPVPLPLRNALSVYHAFRAIGKIGSKIRAHVRRRNPRFRRKLRARQQS